MAIITTVPVSTSAFAIHGFMAIALYARVDTREGMSAAVMEPATRTASAAERNTLMNIGSLLWKAKLRTISAGISVVKEWSQVSRQSRNVPSPAK
jgi:hypothetical protein